MGYEIDTSLQVLERNGMSVVVNPRNRRWLKVTSQSLHHVASQAGRGLPEASRAISEETGADREQVAAFLHELARLGYIKAPEDPAAAPPPGKLHAAYANITNRCNLHCPYCYIGAGDQIVPERDTSFWEQTFDRLAEAGVKIIVISGGEPLLRRDILTLLSRARDNFREVALLTNGTLLNEEIIPHLPAYVDEINVSLDGACAETHERFRGEGTFPLILHNIRRLKEQDFHQINLSPTLTRLNLDEAAALMDLAHELGTGMDFNVFVPAGRGSCSAGELYVKPAEMMNTFMQCWQRSLEQGVPVELNRVDNPFFPGIKHICGAASHLISVAADGSVYPCHTMHHEEFRLGNMAEEIPLEEMLEREPARRFRESVVDTKETCRHCEVRYFCGGGCRSHSYSASDDVGARDPHCLFYHWYYRAAIWTLNNGLNSADNLRCLLAALREGLEREAMGNV